MHTTFAVTQITEKIEHGADDIEIPPFVRIVNPESVLIMPLLR